MRESDFYCVTVISLNATSFPSELTYTFVTPDAKSPFSTFNSSSLVYMLSATACIYGVDALTMFSSLLVSMFFLLQFDLFTMYIYYLLHMLLAVDV